jgi:hypothetical protein
MLFLNTELILMIDDAFFEGVFAPFASTCDHKWIAFFFNPFVFLCLIKLIKFHLKNSIDDEEETNKKFDWLFENDTVAQ